MAENPFSKKRPISQISKPDPVVEEPTVQAAHLAEPAPVEAREDVEMRDAEEESKAPQVN